VTKSRAAGKDLERVAFVFESSLKLGVLLMLISLDFFSTVTKMDFESRFSLESEVAVIVSVSSTLSMMRPLEGQVENECRA
jgi:hypothetical protein